MGSCSLFPLSSSLAYLLIAKTTDAFQDDNIIQMAVI